MPQGRFDTRDRPLGFSHYGHGSHTFAVVLIIDARLWTETS